MAGEPSSIINQVQGGDTLRRNFQQIQVRNREEGGFTFFIFFDFVNELTGRKDADESEPQGSP